MLLDECRLVSETASGRGASEWRDSEEKRRRAEIASGTQQDQGEAPRYWPVTEFSQRGRGGGGMQGKKSSPSTPRYCPALKGLHIDFREVVNGSGADARETARMSLPSSLIATVSHLTPSNSCRSAGPVPPLWKKGGGTPRDAWDRGPQREEDKEECKEGEGEGNEEGEDEGSDEGDGEFMKASGHMTSFSCRRVSLPCPVTSLGRRHEHEARVRTIQAELNAALHKAKVSPARVIAKQHAAEAGNWQQQQQQQHHAKDGRNACDKRNVTEKDIGGLVEAFMAVLHTGAERVNGVEGLPSSIDKAAEPLLRTAHAANGSNRGGLDAPMDKGRGDRDCDGDMGREDALAVTRRLLDLECGTVKVLRERSNELEARIRTMQGALDEYVQQLQVLKRQLSLKDSQIAELKTITVSARAEAAESKRLLDAERQRLTQENQVLTDQLTGPAHLQKSESRLALSLETSRLLRESVDKMAAEMALLERERAEQAMQVKIAKMRQQEVRDLRDRKQRLID